MQASVRSSRCDGVSRCSKAKRLDDSVWRFHLHTEGSQGYEVFLLESVEIEAHILVVDIVTIDSIQRLFFVDC